LSGDPVREQADAALGVLDRTLPAEAVLAAYLYGSAMTGDLRPDSDLDLLAVIARRLRDEERRAIVDGLVPISWRQTRPRGWRPLELTLVVLDDVRPWRYPPRFEFQYGEWLREALVSGDLAPWPESNPDVAVQLTMVRATGRPLRGPAPVELLDAVPHADVVAAILDELPSLLDDLASDTRNVLLTLARMWVTAASGEVLSKDAAAEWALARLPAAHRPALNRARLAYLGELDEAWNDLREVRSDAREMTAEIRRAAAVAPLPPTDASV
jgi:streptomycin 3"-adenylyltransferase